MPVILKNPLTRGARALDERGSLEPQKLSRLRLIFLATTQLNSEPGFELVDVSDNEASSGSSMENTSPVPVAPLCRSAL